MRRKKTYAIAAVDEAGRGPLAGPISVAVVATRVNSKFEIRNSKLLKNIKDSKKLSAKQRGEWLEILKSNFEYKVAMVGAKIIDRIGIQRATHLAVARALRNLQRSDASSQTTKPDLILLDGLLSAPRHYVQKTIIKGDEKIPLISAASIIAKICRDKKMEKLHKIYPKYKFDCHKGYGTKAHYRAIKKYGLLPFHRRSFLTRVKGLKNL
ncbi:ribonuclease HII [Patescibacteria group bacterium]|nr:ribonuclease HII [Patescibacteria group bacterium]